MVRPTKQRAIELLQIRLNAIPGLKEAKYNAPEVDLWYRNTRVTIENVFEDSQSHVRDFVGIWLGNIYYQSDSLYQAQYIKRLEQSASRLQSMISEIEDFWPEDIQETNSQQTAKTTELPMGRKVFLIHGRNHGVKNTVARFLERLQLEPVIMMEQPNQGRTVIEKLEDTADTDFAVALLTPDDEGGLIGGVQQARSRQNVILELGYSIGRLGRNRVCALVQGDVEIPSDYYGVLYIPFDESGAWQQRLIGELKAAGFSIDTNLVL